MTIPSTPQQAISTPNAPALPPVFASMPQNRKPQAKSQQTTFLGAGTLPSMQQSTQKTLLGA